jgi:hypothetical protein
MMRSTLKAKKNYPKSISLSSQIVPSAKEVVNLYQCKEIRIGNNLSNRSWSSLLKRYNQFKDLIIPSADKKVTLHMEIQSHSSNSCIHRWYRYSLRYARFAFSKFSLMISSYLLKIQLLDSKLSGI